MKNFINLFLLICFITVSITPLSVFAFEKTESGIVPVNGLPDFTDKEFSNAPVRIEIFSKEWCKYCQQLEGSMINAIYSKYSKDQVAIRILDAEHPEVEKYFSEYQNMFNVPEERKGRVPVIVINGKYMKVGYGGENTNNEVIEGIGQLLNGEEFNALNPFLLKEEYKGKTDNLIYKHEVTTTTTTDNEAKSNNSSNLTKTTETAESTETAEVAESTKTEGTSSIKQIQSDAYADNISFFAVQGLYDTINNPIFAYMLAVLLFFIAYNKRKSLAFSGLYILGMISANIIARFYNTGLYVYRQPILIALSLIFAYLSLSIFWDILFTTYNKNDKVNIKYSRSLILNALQKFLNSKISYLFAFVFAFAVYFFTTTYDLSYGVIITTDDRFNTALKVLLLIINGICASVLSVFLSMVVQAGKKMSHELIEPLKKYRLNYFGAIFYAVLTFMLIYGIFKMYYYVQ